MNSYCGLLIAIAVVLVGCIVRSIHSKRAISWQVSWLLGFTAVSTILNIFACLTNNHSANQVIYSLNYIAGSFIFFSLLMFVMSYCKCTWGGRKLRPTIFAVTVLDAGMMIANIFTHCAFDVEPQLIDNVDVYNSMVYSWYDNIHWGIENAIVLVALFTLIHKTIHTSRMLSQKYIFMLAVLLITGWWTAYIHANDRMFDDSVAGLGILAIVVFYYAVEYKPLALLDRMKSTIVSTVRDGVLFFDEYSRCIYANNSAKFFLDIKEERDLEDVREKILNMINETPESMAKINSESYRANYADGDISYVFDIDYHKLYDGKGIFIGSFVIIDDRTEEIKKLEREHYLAAHDQLTGLYNTRHFMECVDERVKEVDPTDYVMLTADVRGFKLINDRYGHEAGDNILLKMAKVIENNCSISTRTLYARLTADKFAVFTHKDLVTKERLDKILADFDASFGTEYSVVIHIGIYGLEDGDNDAAVMYDRALMAISSIKNSLDTRVAYYNSKMRENLLWEQRINETLDDALRTGSIVPYLQAQVDGTGSVTGAEVLVRWVSTDEGIIPPYKFIPILEKNGTIAKVDLYMWECACKILRKWADEGREKLYLSVNISPRDFYVLDVVGELKALAQKYQINPSRLRLEITETVMMDDVKSKLALIQELRDAGFILEMDDFGSGYSSLNMLKDMPVDIIKLDMMFMSKTDNKQRTDIIVNLIVKLAYDLGLSVIAEGVETKEQYDNLMGIGCRSFQGYYFAKPIPLPEFETKVS